MPLAPPQAAPRVASRLANERVAELRRLMTDTVGVVRDASGLSRAIAALSALSFDDASPLANRALVGLFIAASAWKRTESRGGHFRSDYPLPSSAEAHASAMDLNEARSLCKEIAHVSIPRRSAAGHL
jgi:L-aspartate oxidase